jgi:hypothetical protein
MKVEMAWNDRTRRLTLRLRSGSRMLPPNRRAVEVRVAGQTTIRRVVFEGKPIDLQMG